MKALRYWPLALLVIPVVLGLYRLRFDAEVLNLLPKDLPVVTGLKLFQQSFSNARELIITVDCSDPAQAEFAARRIAESLRTQTELVASATWEPPFLEAPDQSAELIAYLWLNRPGGVEPLAERLSRENLTNTLQAAREELATSMSPDSLARRAYDPYSLMDLPPADTAGSSSPADQRLFASDDGTFRIVFVEAASELASYPECAAWLASIKESVGRATAEWPAVRIAYTGRPAFVAEIAGGMERDIVISIGSTLLIISTLFYLVHRRWKPLLWLVVLLGAILACTTALGGLLFGALNVVSLGFAAILMGLAVDYGLVLYQEARFGEALTAREIRKTVGPGILWSATTTSVAFVMLNASGLPGLGQLGSLVAIGLVLASFFMLFMFLPPLLNTIRTPFPVTQIALTGKTQAGFFISWSVTALILGGSFAVLLRGGPGFDPTPDALRPARSIAYAAVEEMKNRMSHRSEPFWLLIRGSSESEVDTLLARLDLTLSQAVSSKLLRRFTLPRSLWPSPASQKNNTPHLREILRHRDTLESAAIAHGFNTNALILTRRILETWDAASKQSDVFWPSNRASRWVMGKIAAKTPGEFVTLGLLYPAAHQASDSSPGPALQSWLDQIQDDQVIVSGWQLMGTAVFKVVRDDLPRILIPMVLLTFVALGLAFRRVTEVLLSAAALLISALALWSIMKLAGWSWNLINMMALPLLLGAGVDYSIHMQLALRRHHGDVTAVRRTVGRALLLCAATTFTAFASLSFSSNAGLASLGKVCAAGVLCAFVSAVCLLPSWWSTLRRGR